MINLPWPEAKALSDAAACGEVQAKAVLDGLFGPEQPCFCCDLPIGDSNRMVMLPDPVNLGLALVAPECEGCARLPDRQQREIAVLKAMFPQKRWIARKDGQIGYLKGPPKKRYA
jgi:hypothetical protein